MGLECNIPHNITLFIYHILSREIQCTLKRVLGSSSRLIQSLGAYKLKAASVSMLTVSTGWQAVMVSLTTRTLWWQGQHTNRGCCSSIWILLCRSEMIKFAPKLLKYCMIQCQQKCALQCSQSPCGCLKVSFNWSKVEKGIKFNDIDERKKM